MSALISLTLADPYALIEAALPFIRDAESRPHLTQELEYEAWVACRADLAVNNGFEIDLASAVADVVVAAAWMIAQQDTI